MSHLAGAFLADRNLRLLVALLGQGCEGGAGTDHGRVLMREKLLKLVPKIVRDEESKKTHSTDQTSSPKASSFPMAQMRKAT